MPSGKTHDRVTLLSLPIVVLTIGLLSHGERAMLLVGAGYLFSGLMFAGDLDLHSQQYRRWLWLRWLWLPYRYCLKHRSFWSHGPVVGTALRLVYLAVWMLVLSLPAVLWGWYAQQYWWLALGAYVQQRWQPVHTEAVLWLLLGLELGSLSHSLSDAVGSAVKRLRSRRAGNRSARNRSREGSSLVTTIDKR